MILENQYKPELRKKLKYARKYVRKKPVKSSAICNKLIDLPEIQNAKNILIYLALNDEVNVDPLIDYARSKGKGVAVPYCLDTAGKMKFYFINSLDEVDIGFFGIRSPKTDICAPVTDLSDSVLIVPGLAFDDRGYRLGYGKGYYDRYLLKNDIYSIGVCFNSLIQERIPTNYFDKPVNCVVTESRIIYTYDGGNDGQS